MLQSYYIVLLWFWDCSSGGSGYIDAILHLGPSVRELMGGLKSSSFDSKGQSDTCETGLYSFDKHIPALSSLV